MITCKVGDNIINCYDGKHNKETLKKWSAKKILICSVCGKPYEYCHGAVKIPYFRHMDKTKCEDKYSEPESNEHNQGKRDLFEWVKKQEGVTNAILEAWIPETKQRPDIMFNYQGKKYIIEYQCTPISSEYFERHKLYKTAGINDIWICGVEKYTQFYHRGNGYKKVNVLEKQSRIYYNSITKDFYILELLNEKEFKEKQNQKYLMNDMCDKKDNGHIIIKDRTVNYFKEHYYPSGRPSRKYPYPLSKYKYSGNQALARCEELNQTKLSDIINKIGG